MEFGSWDPINIQPKNRNNIVGTGSTGEETTVD